MANDGQSSDEAESMTFPVTADASGSRDPVTVPANAPLGCKTMRIRPPQGHAWEFSKPNAASQAYAMEADREWIWSRLDQAPFMPGEVPVYIGLDSGSGTFLVSIE